MKSSCIFFHMEYLWHLYLNTFKKEEPDAVK